jgi:hypothetical protein
MTISNKYNAGFCVLTITVVGYAKIIRFAEKMTTDVISSSFQDTTVAEPKPVCASDSYHRTNKRTTTTTTTATPTTTTATTTTTTRLDHVQVVQIKSGANNEV